jgi:hypothetical protein
MSPALFDYLIFIRALLTTFETLIGKGGTKRETAIPVSSPI